MIVPVFKTGDRYLAITMMGSTPIRFRQSLATRRNVEMSVEISSSAADFSGHRQNLRVYDDLPNQPGKTKTLSSLGCVHGVCGASGHCGGEGQLFMTMNSSGDEPRPAAAKKPYEKPAFRYEQVFVTSALHCSKNSDQGQCMLNPPTKAS